MPWPLSVPEPRGILARLLRQICLHARAADLERPDLHARAHAQPARPLRPHETFVSRKAEHINVLALHIEFCGAGRLRRVYDEQQSPLMREPPDAPDVEEVPRQVRRVRADDGPRVRPDERGEVIIAHAPEPVGGDERDVYALEPVERAEHGVVFTVGGDHMIPRRKQPADRDVQRLGRVRRECHMVGARTAEQRRGGLACVVDDAGRCERFLVRAAPGVAERRHGPHDRVDDAGGLAQRRGCVVEIDHGFTTRSACVSFSTMSYMFVTPPTASCSVRP